MKPILLLYQLPSRHLKAINHLINQSSFYRELFSTRNLPKALTHTHTHPLYYVLENIIKTIYYYNCLVNQVISFNIKHIQHLKLSFLGLSF